MSGILDNKSRIIDAILTYEGRRQMSESTFAIRYASFSDAHVVYLKNNEEGHDDPTKRFYFEAFNSPYDQIVFESDDSGNLVPFRQHSSLSSTASENSESFSSFINGKIKSKTKIFSTSSFGSSLSDNSVFGSNFASQIQGILTSSVDNFQQMKIIGTIDKLFEDQNFAISPNQIEFKIVNNSENLQMVPPSSVNMIDTLFNDEKLRNIINFKYLPPIKKSGYNIDKSNLDQIIDSNLLLGDYPPWGPIDRISYSDLKKELKNYESSSKIITFDPTSKDNDIVCQFFEITNNEAKKLDIIEYGRVNDASKNNENSSKHIFFAGKVILDDNGANCFIHLFTIIFESNR